MTRDLFPEFVDDLGETWLFTHNHGSERLTLLCLHTDFLADCNCLDERQ